MKILEVCPNFGSSVASGSAKVIYDLSRKLARRGHSVVVYTSDMEDKNTRIKKRVEEIDGVEVHRFPALGTVAARQMKLFITPKMVRAVKYDIGSFNIVHLHEYRTLQNIIIHHFAKKCGVPYVLQTHGCLPKIEPWIRLKWVYDVFFGYRLLRDASKVIALNQVEAELYSRMGVSEAKIVVVPNGIDLSEFADLPPKGCFKKKFNIPKNKKIILYLGRIHKTKGIDLLIKAHAYMIKQMKCEDTLLVIAGPDDGYLVEAKSLVDSSGTSDSVLFTGFIDSEDKLEALVDADLFVTPSFYGFPMTFLEACAVGTPIVTTTLGDTLDWINGNVGYVTPPTYRSLAKAAYEIISDVGLAERFSRNGRLIVKTKFSLENTVDKIESIYREVSEPETRWLNNTETGLS